MLIAGSALVVAAPVCGFSALIPRLYGRSFGDARNAAVLMAITGVLFAANIPIGHIIWSLDFVKTGVGLALLRGVTLLLASAMPIWPGATGLAAAYFLAAIVQSVAALVMIPRLVRQKQSRFRQQREACAA